MAVESRHPRHRSPVADAPLLSLVAAAVLVLFFVVVACGDAGPPPAQSTAAPTAASPTSTAPITAAPPATTTPALTTTATTGFPDTVDLPPLLVADADGVRVVDDGAVIQVFVDDAAIDIAVPDLTGGVVYQENETGIAEWVWDAASARIRMAVRGGSGPRPIMRLAAGSNEPELLVPAVDARPELVEVVDLDGHPTLVYRVWRPMADAACPPDQIECVWMSVIEDLGLFDLDTGLDRTLTTVGAFESGYLDVRFSDPLIVATTLEYGADSSCTSIHSRSAIDPKDPTGRQEGLRGDLWDRCDLGPHVGCPPGAMCFGSMLATLSPDGTTLAYVQTSRTPEVGPQFVVVDIATWTETARSSVGEQGIEPAWIDWNGTVAVVGRLDWRLPGDEGDIRIAPVLVVPGRAVVEEIDTAATVMLWVAP